MPACRAGLLHLSGQRELTEGGAPSPAMVEVRRMPGDGNTVGSARDDLGVGHLQKQVWQSLLDACDGQSDSSVCEGTVPSRLDVQDASGGGNNLEVATW